MAVSEYRQGKWTPKKVSTDFSESEDYDYEIVRKHYRFFIDRSEVGGDFCIRYDARIKRDAASEVHRLASDEHDEKQRYLSYLENAKNNILSLNLFPLRQIETLKNLGLLPLDNIQETMLAAALAAEKAVQDAIQKN